MSRHKKRIHKKITGKYQDKPKDRKGRINFKAGKISGKSLRRQRSRKHTYLIGNYRY